MCAYGFYVVSAETISETIVTSMSAQRFFFCVLLRYRSFHVRQCRASIRSRRMLEMALCRSPDTNMVYSDRREQDCQLWTGVSQDQRRACLPRPNARLLAQHRILREPPPCGSILVQLSNVFSTHSTNVVVLALPKQENDTYHISRVD